VSEDGKVQSWGASDRLLLLFLKEWRLLVMVLISFAWLDEAMKISTLSLNATSCLARLMSLIISIKLYLKMA